ncbi:DUF6221 family protein [Ruania halotolerans]|uniref:DUF6221 family protein n=1 Tax=Ruania halotolerans TaxID=2897773 RepID=UPI001E3D5545|nr:DUF6221 family protein [Ruania halotolerans]UFU05950.1 DUF6221 family protein [Ruania halotolerans]
MTITEFVHARIADDEAVASRTSATSDVRTVSGNPAVTAHLHRFGPERVLAECAVKRALIQDLWETASLSGNEFGAFRERRELERDGAYPVGLRHLATVYAWHPDFQEGWRP